MKIYLSRLFSRIVSLNLFRKPTDGLFLLGLGSLLVGVGFIVGQPSGNHERMLQFADARVWALLFITYGLAKFAVVLSEIELLRLKMWLSVYGLWLWTYTALSFLVYDPTVPAPTEFMIMLPVLLEAWIFSSLLESNKTSSRRKFNARS